MFFLKWPILAVVPPIQWFFPFSKLFKTPCNISWWWKKKCIHEIKITTSIAISLNNVLHVEIIKGPCMNVMYYVSVSICVYIQAKIEVDIEASKRIWIWILGTATGEPWPPCACQQANIFHFFHFFHFSLISSYSLIYCGGPAWDNGRPQRWCLRRRLGPPSRRGRHSPFTYRDVSYRSHRLQSSGSFRSTRFIEFVFSRIVWGDKGPRARTFTKISVVSVR